MSDWGDRIRAKLDEHSMSVAALARACGIKPPSVHDWLNGKTKAIEGANLIRAASALSVTPEWILTGRGPRERAASASPAPPAPALSPDEVELLATYRGSGNSHTKEMIREQAKLTAALERKKKAR